MVRPVAASASPRGRRASALLVVMAMAISVALLLGVQKLRTAVREAQANTVAGVDLIVGGRGGALDLLLASVFRQADATTGVSWEAYQRISQHPHVEWTIPVALGDSHRGFRVLGTSGAYFEHLRIAGESNLSFAAGQAFTQGEEAVLGADVAAALGYSRGDTLVLAHDPGAGASFEHRDQPFRVAGILARTGTPVDRTVHVSLESFARIHPAAEEGSRPGIGAHGGTLEEHEHNHSHEGEDEHAHAPPADPHDAPDAGVANSTALRHEAGHDPATSTPEVAAPVRLSAFFVGTRNPALTPTMQRAINDYPQEPLMAIAPRDALQQMWNLTRLHEMGLLLVAAAGVLLALLGLAAFLFTGARERHQSAGREAAKTRPALLGGPVVLQAGVLAILAVAIGLALSYALTFAIRPQLVAQFGFPPSIPGVTSFDLAVSAAVVAAALLLGLLPAWRDRRGRLNDASTSAI